LATLIEEPDPARETNGEDILSTFRQFGKKGDSVASLQT